MEDFSDSTNRTIIIIFFLIFYFYLTYVQMSLKIKNNSSNINCSPLSMVIGGFVDGNEASETFKKCVQSSASEDLLKKQKQNNQLYATEIEDIMIDISNTINNNQNITKEQQINMIKALNTNNNNIDDLITKQQNINKTIVESSGPLSELFNKVGDLSTSIKNTFSKFSNSDFLKVDNESYNTLNTYATNICNPTNTYYNDISNTDLCNLVSS